MVRDDEARLRLAVLANGGSAMHDTDPRWAWDRIGMHPKRATAMLDKWVGKGWWEYGVSLRTGWLTDAGRAAIKRTRLGSVLCEEREAAGYSQRALAKAAGCSCAMISLVETGKRTPSLELLAEIAPVLGMPVWELIWRAEVGS